MHVYAPFIAVSNKDVKDMTETDVIAAKQKLKLGEKDRKSTFQATHAYKKGLILSAGKVSST